MGKRQGKLEATQYVYVFLCIPSFQNALKEKKPKSSLTSLQQLHRKGESAQPLTVVCNMEAQSEYMLSRQFVCSVGAH